MFSQFLFYEYLLNLLLRFQTAKPKQAPNFECKGSFPFRRFRRSRFVVRQRQTRWSIWLVTRNPLLNLNSEPQKKNNWLRCEASKLVIRFQEVLGFIKRLNGERSLQYLTFCQSFIHYSKNSCEWVIVSAWNQSTPAKRKIANPRPRHVSQFENEILFRNAMNSLPQKERIGFLRSYTPAESKSLICRRERRRPGHCSSFKLAKGSLGYFHGSFLKTVSCGSNSPL